MHMVSDESLMLEFQAGSRESFENLFARYHDPLYGFFRRRVESKGRAEELAQETWVVVLKGIERYQPRALFRTYLYAIAFKLVTAERRMSRRKEAPLLDISHTRSELPEVHRWVREALERLDSTDREIMMLREYEQLSYLEIAGLLRIPVNTVRSRLFRARVTFRRLLEPDCEAAATAEGRS